MTIREFSKLSGIELTTLRYWDEIGLFRPAKRAGNNYRYYTPDQIIAVNFISVLSSLHIPLKTIGEMGDKRTPAGIRRLIERHEKLLDMEMRRLRECYSVIHARLELINYGEAVLGRIPEAGGIEPDHGAGADAPALTGPISVARREEKPFLLGPPNDFEPGEAFYEPFMRFCRSAGELRINLRYPIGGYHESMDNFLRAPGQPDYFISLDPTGNRKRPAGRYLVGFSRGYYGEFGDLAEKMAAYAEENSLTVSGPVYALYLHDEICVREPSRYLAQVCVAVSPP